MSGTATRHPIGEMDLLAFADGRLDGDPARRAEVEAWLADRPGEAARVASWRGQIAEIRRLYGAIPDEPVPERLLAALTPPPRVRPAVMLARAAALGAVLAAGGLAGWMVAEMRDRPAAPVSFADGFVDDALGFYRSDAAVLAGLDSGGMQPLSWLSRRVALTLEVPDLTEHGFSVTDTRKVVSNGREAVRITYATESGERLGLFLGTRWMDREPEVRLAERDGVAVAWWLDGPLAYGLVSTGVDEARMRGLAGAIRDSVAEPPSTDQPRLSTDATPTVPGLALPEQPARTDRAVLDSESVPQQGGGALKEAVGRN